MNCDDVFEWLTLPCQEIAASERAAIEQHLASCRQCARLAEAIAPAVELFAESSLASSPVSPADEPLWQQIDAPASLQTPIASPAKRQERSLPAEPAAWQAMRLAMAVLIGLTLGGFFYSQGKNERGSLQLSSASRRATSLAMLPVSRVEPSILQSLTLASNCVPHPAQRSIGSRPGAAMPAVELLAQLDATQLACCTDCHAAAGSASHVRAATMHVAQSCQACHSY